MCKPTATVVRERVWYYLRANGSALSNRRSVVVVSITVSGAHEPESRATCSRELRCRRTTETHGSSIPPTTGRSGLLHVIGGASHSHMFDPRPWLLSCLYTAALFFSVPLSLAVWYIRRELIQETTVAGDTQVARCKQFSVETFIFSSRLLRVLTSVTAPESVPSTYLLTLTFTDVVYCCLF